VGTKLLTKELEGPGPSKESPRPNFREGGEKTHLHKKQKPVDTRKRKEGSSPDTSSVTLTTKHWRGGGWPRKPIKKVQTLPRKEVEGRENKILDKKEYKGLVRKEKEKER